MDELKNEQSGITEHNKYTSEQLEAVKKINRTKDLYQILDVPRHCSDDDLKKAYKKLALKFHPDKNQAPGATEAFKSINKAFSILSDAEEKDKYENGGRYTSEDVNESQPDDFFNHFDHFQDHFAFNGFYFTDEMFNMFFERGAFHPNSRYSNQHKWKQRTYASSSSSQRQQRQQPKQRNQQQQQQQQQQSSRRQQQAQQRSSQPANKTRTNGYEFLSSYSFLVQLSPLVFMIFLCLINAFLSYDDVYSLQKDLKYTTERYTTRLNIPFYTKTEYKERYAGQLVDIEKQIEDNHVINLKNKCFQEKSRKEYLLWRARMYNNMVLYEQTKEKKLPSCDQLQTLVASY